MHFYLWHYLHIHPFSICLASFRFQVAANGSFCFEKLQRIHVFHFVVRALPPQFSIRSDANLCSRFSSLSSSSSRMRMSLTLAAHTQTQTHIRIRSPIQYEIKFFVSFAFQMAINFVMIFSLPSRTPNNIFLLIKMSSRAYYEQNECAGRLYRGTCEMPVNTCKIVGGKMWKFISFFTSIVEKEGGGREG